MVSYSINHVMVLILIVVSIVPIVAFGLYSFSDERAAIEKTQLDILRELVHEKEIQVNDFFIERVTDVSVAAQLPFIQKNIPLLLNDDLEKKSESVVILTKNLDIILKAYDYETIWVLDNNFKTQLVVGRNVGEQKPLDLHHFSNDLDLMPHGVYISDVYPGNFGAPSELFVSTPILVNDEQFGYLIFDIDLQTFFQETLLELELSDSGEIVLVQVRDGDVFFIKELRFDNALPFSKFITSNDGFALPAIESASGISGVGNSLDYRGEDILAAWDYVPLTRWGVVAKIDSSEAFVGIDQKQRDIATVVIGFTVSSFIVGYVLSRIIVAPLSKIKDAALKISQKNYDVSLAMSGPIEHKTISKTFNEMVTSIKSYEGQMKEYVEQLQSVDKQKGEFAAMASHELKTPIVPIKGYLEMLLEPGLIGTLTPKQKEILTKIYESTETMEKLVLKLLMAQRLDLGEMTWSISEFNLLDLMNNVYSDNQTLMNDGKKITFVNNTKDSKIISSDHDQLIEIFSNLITNSVDFVPVHGIIEINAIVKEESILFSVKDNGSGMSKDEQKGLFKKFYQVDTSVTRKHGGTGLGLSICKGLVGGMGGEIWVESEKDKGTTFYFTIPIKFQKDD